MAIITTNFLSNFEPLDTASAGKIVDRITEFDRYTEPMQSLLKKASHAAKGYVVASSKPRLVDGKPSKNPRYLQDRPDMVNAFPKYVSMMGVRLFRAIPAEAPVVIPVGAVLLGRRNNPPEPGIRALAVFNPIHYQELPELFMDFVCSLTGKSPSTTGAGSEGALTKSPFNALIPTSDLNAALVSYALTGLGGYSSAAGYVGPNFRVDHDISLLIPELWCRLTPEERDPEFLIAHGYLEKLSDFTHKGQRIMASRLGYRITYHFVRTYFGRLFDNPAKVFDEPMLKPELQNIEVFADGVLNITEAQKRVALQYFEDGSIDQACPPLRALLYIMAHGDFEGKDVSHPDIRAMFTRDYVLNSDWYRKRLVTKQARDIALWRRHVDYIARFRSQLHHSDEIERYRIDHRARTAQAELTHVSSPEYLQNLIGTIGADPM